MSRIRVEVEDKEYVIEYNRDSIIKMEEMGYDALNPASKFLTNFEIMVFGGLLKHQPDTSWKKAIEISEYLRSEYEIDKLIEALNGAINEVFFPKATGKKKKKLKVEK